MLQILSILMVLGLSTSAMASNTKLVATCVGSFNKEMSSAEPMAIAVENGQLWVRPLFSVCSSPVWCISFSVAKANVKSNSQKITAFEQKKAFLSSYKKTLNIDFNTGVGLATEYVPFESLLKAKKLYLQECVKN
jgi:hypothetical protein